MTTDSPFSPSSPADESIGDIIRRTNNLSPDQVEQVLAHQKQTGGRFGESAVALGLANRNDVLWALSQQFHYPYSHAQNPNVSTELVVANDPFSEVAEAFRDLRSQLMSSAFENNQIKRALAVVSPDTNDGKSFFAANLAVTFSQLGGRTLLMDADMRTPRLDRIFGIESNTGLSGILAGRSETNVIRPISELPSLYVLPVGVPPPNPLELVQRPAFKMLMCELVAKFDYIIVDTPAATHGADARVIAGACGMAVMIGRKNTSSLRSMGELANAIKKQSAQLVGVVTNDF
jgi:protein-tyrosine kinase